MPIMRTQVIIPATSLNPEDSAMNVWHFDFANTNTATFVAVETALDAFYTSIRPRLSPKMGGIYDVRHFNLAEPSPRQPIRESTIAVDSVSAGTTPLPSELCAVLSFRATPTSGANAARRRGRLFIGPLATSALGGTSTTNDRLESGFRIALAQSADDFLSASTLSADWTWVVYSRVGGTSAAVVDGWVDDAVDIQRRRGVEPTVRSTFS